MIKLALLLISISALLGMTLSNTIVPNFNYGKEIIADTITSITKQNVGNKTIFKAPNGKFYKINFEKSIDPLEKAPLHCENDDFSGKARKIPKTTIATSSTTETFTTLKSFLNTLPPDAVMKKIPEIHKGLNNPNNRVALENRNVRLTNVFLFAVKREGDNDYHMIIGDGNNNFLNTENSGLLTTSPQKLKDVRKAVVKFLGNNFCFSDYLKFQSGVAVEIEGSIFFDTEHETILVGTASAKPKTAWEVHPITNIIFK